MPPLLRCIIGATALVPERMQVPDGSVVMGSPGKVVKVLSAENQAAIKLSAAMYVQNKERFRAGLVGPG